MNRLQYRIVFNKKRGQLMAVAETASSQSKGSGQSRRRRRGAGRGPRGAAGTLALLALSSLGALWPAQAQIQADPNAPKNQQPTVLSTANGVPLVNIQTPSSAGVSRNTYSQFDVRANGAVLNNARSDAATQLGGWVQGNPWLAKGGARVILNEVNSSQPSQLRGYVEIAGQKAELIIANPAGIQVDGAGFINASSATLTTGLPRWQADGQITGYAVQGGLISVDGKGLDASQTDYTALLARAAAVNAGIWAKALRITTGANLISADHAETTPTAGTGHAPSFALDVSALGGMYAGGKIVLLGTEHGVGVRNAGTLGALGGELTLTVDGRLYNSGTLQSSTHTRLQAREGVSNAGTVSATGELGIATEADIDNAGGTLNAARIELGAAALRNRGGSIEQTGTQALRLSGALLTNREAGQIGVSAAAESGSGSEETAAPTQGDNTPAAPPAAPPVPQPDAGASDGGSTAPAPVPLADGVIAISGPLDNDGGRIHAGGAIDLKAGAGLNNDAGRMGLRQLTLGGGELGNRGGSLSIAGTAAITASTLNNDAGQLSVGGPLRMTAGQLSNRAGQIILSGTEATELPVAAEFDNTDGTLASSASALTLRAGRLANERGRILHAGQQGLTIEAQTLLGQAGTIETPGALSLRAGQLDHRAASLTAAQLSLSADTFDNRGGSVQADAGLQIQAGSQLNNGEGGKILAALGSLAIEGQAELSNGGLIAARDGLALQARQLTQLQGAEISGQALRLQLQGRLLQDDSTASLLASRDLTLEAGSIALKQGLVQAGGRLDLVADTQAELGGRLHAGTALQVRSAGDITVGGMLSAQQQLILKTAAHLEAAPTALLAAGMDANGELQRTQGLLQIQAGQALAVQGQLTAAEVQLQAPRIDLHAGRLLAGQQAVIQAEQALITEAAQLYVGQLQLQASDWQHAGGRLEVSSAAPLSIALAGLLDNRQGLILVNSASLALEAQRLDNAGGLITSSGDLLRIQGQRLDNQGGAISSVGALKLQAATLLNNRDGQLEGQAVQITGGSVSNLGQGLISARGTLNLNASQLDNAGSLQSQGDATLIISSGALNNSGLIYAQGTGQIQAAGQLTHSGTVAAQGGLTVSADSIASSGTLAAGLKPDNSLAAQGDLTLSATQTLQHSGTALAAGRLDMQAATLQLQDSKTQAQQHIGLLAQSGELRLDRAVLASAGALTLNSATLLNTEAAQLSSAGSVDLTAQDWRHAGGALNQTDAAGRLNATLTGTLDNQGGRIAANGGALSLSAEALDNRLGQIGHAGAGELRLQLGQLAGAQGQILAKERLTLTARGAIDLDQAQTQARHIALEAGASLSHRGGQLLGLDGAQLDVAGALDNQEGLLQSTGDLRVQAAELRNHDGQIDGRDVRLTSAGHIANTGRGLVQAQGSLRLNASQLDNAGSLQSQGDATLIISSGALNNSGLIYAQGTGQIQAAGQLTHSGTIAAQGGLTVSADSIASSGTLAAGLKPDNSLATEGDLTLSATQTLQHSGTALAAGRLDMQAATLQLQDSQLQGQPLTLKALSGELRLDRAQLASAGALTLSSATLLNTEAAALSAATASLTAQDWQHAGGQLTQLDTAGSLRATVSRKLDNRAGRISANGQGLTLSAPTLDNSQGEITHAGAGELKLDTATLTGVQGQILAKHLLTLTASGAIDLSQAQTQAQTISLTAASLKHQAGQLLSLSDATLTVAGLVNNTAGQMQAANALNVHAATLDNRDGQLDGQSLLLQGGSLSNLGQGLITARGPLTLNATQLDNAGSLQSQGDARLSTTGALNNSGLIYAQGTGQIQAAGQLTHSGTIAAQGGLTVSADSIASSGTLAAGLKPDNTLATQGDLSLTASQTLQHSGTALAAGQLDVRAASLQLQDSQLQAHNIGLQALSGELRLDRAALASATGLTLSSATLLNTEAAQLSAATVGLTAQDWQHAGGQLTQLDTAGSLLATVSRKLDNRAGRISANGQGLTLSAPTLDNSQGEITHAGAGELKLDTATLTGVQGQILAKHLLTLTASGAIDLSQAQTQAQTISLTAASLKHQAGQLLSLSDATLTVAGLVNNTAGQMQAANALNVHAATLDNRDGQLDGQSLLLQGGSVSNLGQGLITARGPLTLNATQLDNAGSLQSQGDARLSTTGALNNSGLIYAQGTGQIQAAGQLTHSGTIAAQGGLTVSADSIASSGTLAAGLKPDNSLATEGDLTLSATQTLQHSGTALAAGRLDMQAATLQLQDSQLQGQPLTLKALSGELRLDRAQLASAGALTLSSATLLNTEAAQLSAATVGLTAQDWQHAGGQLTQLDTAGSLLATVSRKLDNREGRISANGQGLTLSAPTLDNSQGEITHAGAGELKLDTATLTGVQGQILAKGALTLAATGAVDLSQAQTQAQTISLTAASLKHQAGQLLSLSDATLTVAGLVNNTAGQMQAANALNVHAATLDNRDGQLDGQSLLLQGGSLSNLGQGLITARGPLTLNATQLDNAGSLQSQGDARLSTTGALNNSGLIYAQGTGQIQAAGQLTHSGTIAAQGGLTVSADSIASSGTLAAGLKPDNSLATEGDLTLSATQTLQHSGTALAAGRLDMQAATLQLQDSQLQGQPLTLKALSGELRLDRAQLASAGALTLSSATLLNTEAAQLSAATVGLTAQDWQHAGGQLTQLDTAGSLLATVSRKLDNREGRISANGQGLTLSAPTLDNSQGEITHAGAGELKLDTATLTGVQGQILAKHLLTLTASGAIDLSQAQTQAQTISLTAASLKHQAGQLLSLSDATLTVAGLVNNTAGQMQAANALNVHAATLDNRDGQLDGQSLLLQGGSLSNLGQGLITARGPLTLNATQLDNAGSLQSQGDARLSTTGALNNSGLIYAQGTGQIQAAGQLTHSGTIAAQGGLTVSADSIASSGTLAAGLKPDNSLATEGDLTLSATQTLQHSGTALAAGRLDMQAATLQLQDSQLQGQPLTLKALSGELRLDRAQLASAGALTLSSATLLNTEAAQLSAATVGLTAQDWQHAGGQLTQLDTAGSLLATVSRKLDNREGRISANGQGLTLSAPTLDNSQGEITHAGAGELKLDTATLTGVQGQILAKHLLTLTASGAIDLSQAQTQAQTISLTAASLKHQAGQLLSLGDATLTVAGDLDNQTGQLSSSGGRLQVQAATLDNRDGQLGGQSKLQLTSTALTRNGGQGLLWSQGALVLEAGELANAGGIQAQGDALLTVGGQLLNSGRIYSQGQTTVRADSLVHTGLLAAQGALDMRALTSIASSGGFAAGLRPDNSLNTQGAATLSLTAGQALQHSGSLLAAGRLDLSGSSLQLQNSQTQAGAVVLSASTGELRLDSAKLTSAAGLSLVSSQATLNTEGAQLSAAGTVGITAQHWHHAGGVLSQTDAAGPLQATVQGLIDNRGGQISSNGATLTLNALQRLDNSAGGLISQASSDAGSLLRIQTGQLDGASGKILSAGALTLDISGGAANLSQAQTQAQRIHLSADSLNHQGGQMLSLGLGSAGTSTLNIAGRLDNRSGSVIVSDAGTLELAVGSLLNGVADGTSTSTSSSNSNSNSGGLLQSGGDLTLRITDAGGTLDNQGGRIRSGGHALLTAALIDNRQGWVGSDGSLTLKTPGELRNAAGTLWAQQGLALEALTLDNQKGRIASLKAGVSVRAQGLVDNSQQGSIVAEQTLDLAAGGLLNSGQGELSGTDLIVDTGGQALDNRGGRLLAKQSMRVNSGQLDNQGGLLQSLGSLSVDTHGAALLNTLSATPLPADTLTGIHAKGALTLSSGELLNSAGISSGSGLAQIKASQLNNRALISGETLQLTISGTLDNQGGRLRGSQALQAGAQQLLNQGGAIYGGQDLTLTVAGLIDNRDTGGSASDDTLGIQGKNLTLQAAQLDNRAGRVLANGQLQLKLSQLLDNNTGGLLSAQGEQRIDNGLGSLPTASALAVNNATGSIWSGQGLTLSARELGSGQTGRISSGGSLSLSLSGDLVYGGGGGGGASSSLLQAQGDTTLNLSGNFINQGTLRSGGALAITAAGIDNQAGAELSGTETRLSASASLSNRGLIDGGRVTLDAGGQLLNIGSGRLYGDSITLTAASLANGAEAGQAAVIAARQSLDAQLGGELSNRDGALIFADGTMQLAANSLLNENASIEASSWLRLDTRSGAAINRSLYAEVEVNGTQDPSNPRLLASKAFISSGGDMHISGASLVNSGATVEARGNLTLQAAEIQNLNPYLKWQQGQGEATSVTIVISLGTGMLEDLSWPLNGRTVDEALEEVRIFFPNAKILSYDGGAPAPSSPNPSPATSSLVASWTSKAVASATT